MRNKLGSFLAIVVVAVAAFVVLRPHDGVHGRVGDEIHGSLRAKFGGAIPHGTPAYLIGAGISTGEHWYAATFHTKDGQCVAVTGLAAASGGSSCERKADFPIDAIEGGTDRDVTTRFAIGTARADIETVAMRSDDGYQRRVRTVAVPKVTPRFFTIVTTGHLARAKQTEFSGTTFHHSVVSNAPDEQVDQCTNATPPLRGVADALPQAGQTTVARVLDIAHRDGDALVQQYGATALASVPRRGQVWRRSSSGAVIVVDAADAMLRLYVPSVAACPPSPQSHDGVPVQFVIGAAPPPAQVYPARTPPG